MTTNAQVGENGRLVGTRISVWDVLQYTERGRTYGEIAEVFPLTREQFDAVMQYVDAHRDYVYEVHERLEERNRRGNPHEIEEKLVETRKRMKERRADSMCLLRILR